MAGYVQLSRYDRSATWCSVEHPLLTLRSLLAGPTTHIEHDENGDGSFKDLTGSLPLSMLIYFSSTIRNEHQVSLSSPPPFWAPPAHQTWYGGHQQRHSYYMAPVNAPTRIRLIGGDPTAHLDMIHWMTCCCQQNTIISLSSIIASPTRFILAMTSIRILGITILDHELPNLVKRLENEMVDVDTAGRVFASGDGVLPEVRKSICTCVAGYFFADRLQDVDRWIYLGKMNRRFDEGVCRVLEGTRDKDKLGIWKSRDAQGNAPRFLGGAGRHVTMSMQEEPGQRVARAFPSSNVRVDHPSNRPLDPAPPPPPPKIPPQAYWQQHEQSAYRPFEYGSMPPQVLSYHTQGELRPDPDRRIPSPSTTFSTSPSPRTRRVRFDDTSRVPRVPTAPPAGWTPHDTRQPAASGPQYNPYADFYHQQPVYHPYGGFPHQAAPQPSYIPSRPGEYAYGQYRGGEQYYRYY